jgi:hypothetical protein
VQLYGPRTHLPLGVPGACLVGAEEHERVPDAMRPMSASPWSVPSAARAATTPGGIVERVERDAGDARAARLTNSKTKRHSPRQGIILKHARRWGENVK